MKFASVLVLSIASLSLLLPPVSAAECDAIYCDSPNAMSCGDESCSIGCSSWSGGVDAIFWSRTQKFSDGLVLDESNPPAFALTGDDLDFDFEAGIRATIAKRIGKCESIEFIYFGIDEWSESAIAIGSNNRSLPGDAGLATFDFFNADAIEASYRADTTNMEVNFQIDRECWKFLFGFRYLELDESFRLAAFDADTFTSDYRVDTENDLYGGQVGLRYDRCFKKIDLSAVIKSGIYANASGQDTLFRDLSNTLTLRDISRIETVAASISEIGLNADVRLTECIGARVGYNLLWATDLALAPYQLDFTDTASSSDFLNNNHSVFMHGVNVGIVLNF